MSDVACAVFSLTSSGLGFCEVHPPAEAKRLRMRQLFSSPYDAGGVYGVGPIGREIVCSPVKTRLILRY